MLSRTLYSENDLLTQVVSCVLGQIMKEGDSWAETGRTGGQKCSSGNNGYSGKKRGRQLLLP